MRWIGYDKSCNTDSSLTGIFCTRILGDLTIVFKLQSLVEKKHMKNRKHHERSAKTFVDLNRFSTAFASTFCWIGYDKEFSWMFFARSGPPNPRPESQGIFRTVHTTKVESMRISFGMGIVVMSYGQLYMSYDSSWWKLKKEKITPPCSDSASLNELQLCEEPSLLSTLPVATIARHAIARSWALYLLVLRCSHSWVLHGAYSAPLAQSPVRAHWEKSNDFHFCSVEPEFHLWKSHLEMVQKEPLLEVM